MRPASSDGSMMIEGSGEGGAIMDYDILGEFETGLTELDDPLILNKSICNFRPIPGDVCD